MELTRLEIELEKTESDLHAAKQELIALQRSLDLWLGDTLPEGFRVEADWTQLPSLPNLDTALEISRKNHPTINIADHRVQAADALVRVERNRLFPELKVGGFYDKEMDAENYGGMVSVEVPLWNWNCGGIKKAKAELSAARHRKSQSQRELIDALFQVHAQASHLMDRARRYKNSILPKAQEAAKAHERMYQVGETSVMDLLDARRSLVETETEMQDAFLEGWLAYLDLLTLIGDDNA